MRHHLAALAVVIAAAVASPSGAIGLLEELGRIGLNNDDFGLASEAAERLYTAADVKPGARTTWQNPETGAQGEIEILEVEGRCVLIKHLLQSAEQEQVRRIDVKRCRGDDGVWRISG